MPEVLNPLACTTGRRDEKQKNRGDYSVPPHCVIHSALKVCRPPLRPDWLLHLRWHGSVSAGYCTRKLVSDVFPPEARIPPSGRHSHRGCDRTSQRHATTVELTPASSHSSRASFNSNIGVGAVAGQHTIEVDDARGSQ